MRCSRRSLFKSSALLLGANLTDILTTPLGALAGAPLYETHASQISNEGVPVTFVDVAEQAGLVTPNVWGGVKEKKYIIETKGSGIAFFDYDNDGWLDIYLTNGVRLGETYAPGETPTPHLYKNNRDGTFTDVTEQSGLARTGWQTGVCVGDYDNDGWDDLFLLAFGATTSFSITMGMERLRM